MGRLWIKEIIRHRIARQFESPCAVGNERETLSRALIEMDMPQPMWLGKHDREYEKFRRTAFTAEHFVEPIRFDKLEIEYIDDEKNKKQRERAGRYYDE